MQIRLPMQHIVQMQGSSCWCRWLLYGSISTQLLSPLRLFWDQRGGLPNNPNAVNYERETESRQQIYTHEAVGTTTCRTDTQSSTYTPTWWRQSTIPHGDAEQCNNAHRHMPNCCCCFVLVLFNRWWRKKIFDLINAWFVYPAVLRLADEFNLKCYNSSFLSSSLWLSRLELIGGISVIQYM